VNCHYERGHPSLAARIVPVEVPTLEVIELNTDFIQKLCNLRDGLILVTGPTGSGKSTTLAAMVDAILSLRPANIITLEDPIEFLFEPAQGVVRQREYGQDFHSFGEALKRVLRQDPDIVMVGEMRDLETIAAALTLAETGHLILATLHTPNVVQTVDRIVDVFPPHQQHQIRTQLSLSLQAVIAQRLVPRQGGGRVAVREVLVNTPAVSNIIRENRLQELQSVVQTGGTVGMVTFAKDAKRLYKAGAIDEETYNWLVA
jgi:twitching motility protein PilT